MQRQIVPLDAAWYVGEIICTHESQSSVYKKNLGNKNSLRGSMRKEKFSGVRYLSQKAA